MKLRDIPDATFVAIDVDGSFTRVPDAKGAHAIWFQCPCGKHHNLIAFEPTIDTEPTTRGGLSRTGGRWQRTGTTLDDLTLTPSIDVNSTSPGGSCWHGFITNGDLR